MKKFIRELVAGIMMVLMSLAAFGCSSVSVVPTPQMPEPKAKPKAKAGAILFMEGPIIFIECIDEFRKGGLFWNHYNEPAVQVVPGAIRQYQVCTEV